VLLSADGVAADAIMATTDLPLAFHPSATEARLMFAPIGAGLAIARRAEPLSCAADRAIATVGVRAQSTSV
jgi:hypothetical protein